MPEKDEYSVTRQQMRASIDVCMGGKAAEELIFGGWRRAGGAGARRGKGLHAKQGWATYALCRLPYRCPPPSPACLAPARAPPPTHPPHPNPARRGPCDVWRHLRPAPGHAHGSAHGGRLRHERPYRARYDGPAALRAWIPAAAARTAGCPAAGCPTACPAPVSLPRAVAVGEEQSPSTRQAVDTEVAAMLKGAYQRVTRWAAVL